MHVRRTLALFMAASAALSVSCGGSAVRYAVPPNAPAPRPLPVRIWAERTPLLPPVDLLAGCDVWASKGVVCSLTQDRSDADVRVYARAGCATQKDGLRTLALSYEGGNIEMRTDCFAHDGSYDLHEFRAVFGHEIGHQLGIWTHVPLKCSAAEKRLPLNLRRCGVAIMNPIYDKDVYFITVADARAFDLRDTSMSVVFDHGDRPSTPHRADTPICVYRGK